MKKIAIISPATFTKTYDAETVKNQLNKYGYEPVYGDHAFDHNRFAAGTDEHRAEDIMWAFTDTSIDAIMALRGGYASARLLDKLNYNKIKNNPKPLFGFSDITALQLALWKKSQIVSYTGIQASFFQQPLKPALSEVFKAYTKKTPITFGGLSALCTGETSGRLLGGTLSVLTSLIGTPYMPDFKNAILLIEDIKEEPYKIDRMLTQLRLAGIFKQISGVVIGQFHECLSKDPLDGTIQDVIFDHFHCLNKPTVMNIQYGHHSGQCILPIGSMVELDATQGVLNIDVY